VHPQPGTGRHRRHLARMDQLGHEPRHLRLLVSRFQKVLLCVCYFSQHGKALSRQKVT
jgi:hypothetical protein